MPQEPLRHIFLKGRERKANYTYGRVVRITPAPVPIHDPKSHRDRLANEWAAVWAKAKEKDEERKAVHKRTKAGVYIQFQSMPGFEFPWQSLEDQGQGIKLLNVQQIAHESPDAFTLATVYFPAGKEQSFLTKLDQYVKSGRNTPLVATVDQLRLAVFESFWCDNPDLMPVKDTPHWCEVWLRCEGDSETEREAIIEEFLGLASDMKLSVRPGILRFPERAVALCHANRAMLVELGEGFAFLAEFRRAKETAAFFMAESPHDQTEWARDLLKRLEPSPTSTVAVTVLDTGCNNGHLLLQPLLKDIDCQAVNTSWGATDHDGHGTLMCGLVGFGDLTEALISTGPFPVPYLLESCKVLPPRGRNAPDLYGYTTQQAVSLSEIQAPERVHISCMAVTSTDGRDYGRPSSWSAAVDATCSGAGEEGAPKRLFIMSAGNIDEPDQWRNYHQSNCRNYVHDPAQSWNALTVGAFTQKVHLDERELVDWEPLAAADQLSPFSTTSLAEPEGRSSRDKWPYKPDIVLEGGNVARGPDGFLSEFDGLSLLSTNWKPQEKQFGVINATSAATALAARMAARVQASYPEAWPETVRGLLVHSARWPRALRCQLFGREPQSKTEHYQLLRYCGYGVPDLERARHSTQSQLTMITQAEFQPFHQNEKKSVVSKEMHLHRLPWPKDLLLHLGELQVTLRVTLSYFIEPSPGERGWKDRYVYPSHQFRFSLNKVHESELEMEKRLSRAARDEDETVSGGEDGHSWVIGPRGRTRGTVHSDSWTGTAADLATTNLVGVYPATGWWKSRQHLGEWARRARYSLIVSIETPAEEIDIYTPVATQIGIQIPI
ncbi:MAG: S8 family peptidase [Candidatus Sumerlaeia bacterium]|nr:S8 family peptidase [Candidatus Sumerlaeia bacterium]